jgi:hypothetical protein
LPKRKLLFWAARDSLEILINIAMQFLNSLLYLKFFLQI